MKIRLREPGFELVFGRRDSESDLQERLRQESELQRRAVFPAEPELSKVAFAGRSFSPSVHFSEPNYVVYHRLYFEEVNSERYGWELGGLQPIVSAGVFFKDLLFLPHKLFSYPCNFYDSSAGYCLPGDPVAYLIYPPHITATGTLAEVGVIAALWAILPGYRFPI